MEFKKIDDKKFQCLLFEEDLEENNISLDDFFRNDTEKIHGLLDVVMEEARKEIGIAPSGEMISLQLAPQPIILCFLRCHPAVMIFRTC